MKNFMGIELILAGGLVRLSDGGIVGGAALDFINQFKTDFAVIGVSAIDEDGALLDYDLREVRVAQAIIRNARHVILVADMQKLERTAPVRLGHVSDIDTIVTDGVFPPKLRDICRDSGVQIVVAEEEAA
jgi:DeoR family glycerol-3-phosphate regulon repressor